MAGSARQKGKTWSREATRRGQTDEQEEKKEIGNLDANVAYVRTVVTVGIILGLLHVQAFNTTNANSTHKEQLAQKKASKELRGEVLEQLKAGTEGQRET